MGGSSMSARHAGKSRPGMVRIVAGSRRGRRLKVPSGNVRPTGERVREAIFDALGPITGLTVLDLFAGTGAMGLEAISRGAVECVFVESDPAVAATLRANIASLEMDPHSTVIVAGYADAGRRLADAGRSFDLLFVDPPYRMLPEVEAMLRPLLPRLAAEDGLVVIEGSKAIPVDFPHEPVFDRVYGDTRVTMISMRRNDP